MPYTPFYPTWHNSGVALDTPITGDALNHIDAGIATAQATAEAAGGAPQIAAKSTDATPWGAPGLYANSSTDPADGGWAAVDITANHAELTLGNGPIAGSAGYIDITSTGLSQDVELHAASFDGTQTARARIETSARSAGASASLDFGDPDGSGRGVSVAYDSDGGATIQVQVAADQAIPALYVQRTGDNQRVFQVDTGGLVLFSPNGSGWRVTVDDAGALTATAV
jgi:hypothetical protein